MSAVLDFPVRPEARPYVGELGDMAREPEWLAQLRQENQRRFSELGFPSRRSERWRYLDLRDLEANPLMPAVGGAPASFPTKLVLDEGGVRLVLFEGLFAPKLSRLELPAGVWLKSIGEAIDERPELVRSLAVNTDADQPFAALNAALFFDGFVLDVAPGVVLDRPIEIVHLANDPIVSLHTRSLINLGKRASASVLEVYVGKGRYWRNDVVAVRLADDAELTRTVVVEEGASSVHLAQLDAALDAQARLSNFVLLLGGKTVRQEANVTLAGEGAHCRLDGAYIVSGDDEANIVTSVDHAAPGGHTSELIKGVAAGRGHGAFQGRITVREHAQKTDAHQLSRNLLIGARAVIDTKPELEIYADDVKCSHGASIGDLDEAALFYLRARGIPAEEARHMLLDAFLREAVETIGDLAIRTHLLRRLAARLAQLEGSA